MYCRALRSACTVLPSTSCFCSSPAGARVLQQMPSVKQYGAMPTGSQYCLVRSDFGMHAYRVGDKRVLSHATQRVHSTALHKLLLHQPGRRARVLGTSNQSSVDHS